MRKLILALSLVSFVLLAQEAWNNPGWACRDIEILQIAKDTAPDNYKTASIVRLVGAQNPNDDFATLEQKMRTALMQDDITETDALNAVKTYCYNTKRFADELIAYCQENPSNYDFHIAVRYHKSPWARQRVADLIMHATITPAQVMNGLSVLVTANINGEITDENMKALLRKIDLRYTDILSRDKEKWAPVVAKIRTLYERYE